ncbi:hypothetical protein DFJ73DRAFT_918550 [Zopfochytrium polystomum]|nr:hypothetical protein DFJ73DRAFT_918550 [Zopfochytrium polystomum]
MRFSGIIAPLAAIAASFVSAAPSPIVVDKKMPSVRYIDGVQLAPDAHVLHDDGSKLFARASANDLINFGGPVLKNVEVTMLLWGTVAYGTDLAGFYEGVTNSIHFDMLSQYSGIGRGSYKGSITLTGQPSSTSLTDETDIQNYLRRLVAAGTLKPTANSYFPIHLAPGISVTRDGMKTCSLICAYHGAIDISDISPIKYLFYGVVPDQGGACDGLCGKAPSQFGSTCAIASQQLVSATTDPVFGLSFSRDLGFPMAWYNRNRGEIGSICDGQLGTVTGGNGVTYIVQKEWSNKNSACVLK